jgi:hypothetical protein
MATTPGSASPRLLLRNSGRDGDRLRLGGPSSSQLDGAVAPGLRKPPLMTRVNLTGWHVAGRRIRRDLEIGIGDVGLTSGGLARKAAQIA